jgi:hypothetical protein
MMDASMVVSTVVRMVVSMVGMTVEHLAAWKDDGMVEKMADWKVYLLVESMVYYLVGWSVDLTDKMTADMMVDETVVATVESSAPS